MEQIKVISNNFKDFALNGLGKICPDIFVVYIC